MLTSGTSDTTTKLPSRVSDGDAFIDYLESSAVLDSLAADRAKSARRASAQRIDTVLLELGLLEEETLAENLSSFLGLSRVQAADFPATLADGFAAHLPFLRRTQLIPIAQNESTITLATATPLDDTSPRAFGYLLGLKPILRVATRSALLQQFEALSGGDNGDAQSTSEFNGDDIERLRDVASEAPIIKLLNRLIASAVDRQASDIHIELLEDHLRVRYRIDGYLQIVERLERGLHLGLVSRIKILSRLNIAEQRLPQDGRMRLAVKGRDIDLRVATSPTSLGENLVLRVLDKRGISFDLESLGFAASAAKKLNQILIAPNGVILVTGPTGSGKTTTLYAALSILNKPDSKIFSIEDPIEYNMRGINQILVRPQIELTFANILRSVLRQDPDVIMVGEIRDKETAQIAVQAALTGHLVLSTLHTNSAVSSITRLRDLGIDEFLITSSVRAILAQRLVRKLCKICSGEGQTCNSCHGTGYSGRTVVYEILTMSDAIRQAVTDRRPEIELENLAKAEGMIDIEACGQSKIRSGETSVAELLSLTGGT